MIKVTHTHRGHCQFCLRVHALDVGTGLVAKHGYTVSHGYFRGECPGSGALSLHVERIHTDTVIRAYRERQARFKDHADALESGTVKLESAWDCYSYGTTTKYWSGKYHKVTQPHPKKAGETIQVNVRTMLAWADANEEQRARQLAEEVEEARSEENYAKGNADTMTEWAVKVFDQKMPAYRNEDLDNFLKVGDTVHLGGEKNGFEAKVEAITDLEYTTMGFQRGRQTVIIPHAQVTRPAIADTLTKAGKVKKAGRVAHTYWEPVRNIRPPKGSLVALLKAADLI